MGHQQLVVSSTAVGLTVPTGKQPHRALIYVGADDVRWRADGTVPTASIGVLVGDGNYLDLTAPGGDFAQLITNIRFIRVTTDATLDIEYFS